MPRILIVDDSALMRRQLTTLFEAEAGFEVRVARNGREALEENQNFEPDVITLDINMPEMDGLTALAHLMTQRPVPVVMVSSLTERGALASFEAMALGAVDYIAKPGGTISLDIGAIGRELVAKVRGAVGARLRPARLSGAGPRLEPPVAASLPSVAAPKRPITGIEPPGLVLIGVSTGGPRTLEDVLPHLPADFPFPVLVAQHMPASFTAPFAKRLNDLCPLNVIEADRPMPLTVGNVYIGKGGADLVLARRAGTLMAMPRPEHPEHLWHPSVELMGRSALEHVDPQRLIAVMLTGMGHDGADAFTEIRRRGGRTIAESEQSAVVFGMPAELIQRGGAQLVMNSDRVAAQLLAWSRRN